MYSAITQDISLAARAIQEGRVVAFPTGTAYGLAVDAVQGHALQRLRNLKQRPPAKSFTVFVRPDLLHRFFRITHTEKSLLDRLVGQPLTLLVAPLPALEHLAVDGRVGLRLIDHPLMEALALAVNVPLTATSANIAGGAPCDSPVTIQKTFPGKLDPTTMAYGDIALAGDTTYDLSLACILDGGELPVRQPTTIARLDNDQVIIVRQGELRL